SHTPSQHITYRHTPTAPDVPRPQTSPIRIADAAICPASSPLAVSAMSACRMANGLGRKSGLTQPKLPAACHVARIITKAARLPYQRGLMTKPRPRKRTGRSRGALTSDMCDLAFGIDRLAPDQRPEVLVQTGELGARSLSRAIPARNRHFDDLA